MSDSDINFAEDQRQLLLRHLDGQLPPEQTERVADLLRSNLDARTFVREVAEQAVVVADVERTERFRRAETEAHGGRAAAESPASSRINESAARRVRWGIARAATVAIVLVGGALLFSLTRPDPDVAQIMQLHGAIQWTGDGGQVVRDLEVGSSLRGGTLETLSADSWVEFRFRDGSTMTVSGPSIVTFSERQQKELHLREGSLSASVTPQADAPMLIHTPTAKLEVLGTQLNVEAESSVTRLNVNEGRVRITRLVDGSVAEVTAEHQIVASVGLDEFRATRRPVAVDHWESQFSQRPEPESVHGNWIPSEDGIAARLQTVPTLINIPGIDPFTLYVAGIGVSKIAPSPVLLETGSRFYIRGRIELAEGVRFGITAYDPNGGCAGKFEAGHSQELTLSTNGGWFDVQVPLAAFRRLEPGQANSTAGLILKDFYVYTIDPHSNLELTQVELRPRNEEVASEDSDE